MASKRLIIIGAVALGPKAPCRLIPMIPMINQKTIFVILSAAKNLSFKAAEILHSAALRSK